MNRRITLGELLHERALMHADKPCIYPGRDRAGHQLHRAGSTCKPNSLRTTGTLSRFEPLYIHHARKHD